MSFGHCALAELFAEVAIEFGTLWRRSFSFFFHSPDEYGLKLKILNSRCQCVSLQFPSNYAIGIKWGYGVSSPRKYYKPKQKKNFRNFQFMLTQNLCKRQRIIFKVPQWALPTQHLCDFFPVRYWSIPNPNAYI